jgi:DNA polymerase delta subunit 1
MDWASIPELKRPSTHAASPLELMVTSIDPDPKQSARLHIFGSTREGASVHVSLGGVKQYMWAAKPDNLHFTQLDEVKKVWNGHVRGHDYGKDAIASIEIHKRESLMYYKPEELAQKDCLKITVNTPGDFNNVRKYLRGDGENGTVELAMGNRLGSLKLYEEQGLNYTMQFMRDYGVSGFGWLSLSQFTINQVHPSNCTIDVCALAEHLKAYTTNDDPEKYGAIAPLRLFTFDIETLSLDPLKGAVIQIGVHLKEWGSGGERMLLDTMLFTGETDPIDGCTMAYYENERDLLIGFQQLVQASDFDISRSYNGRRFDWPFLMDRAEHIGIQREFSHLSRMKSTPASIKRKEDNTGKKGKPKFRDVTMPGRVEFDICDVLVNDPLITLSSYKLNSVCMEFLKDANGNVMTKEDVHWTMISVLYAGSTPDRTRLARYCRKDALLPCVLDEKLNLLIKHIELARLCGITLIDLRRGQQIKVFTQIAGLAKEDGLLLPIKQKLTTYRPESFEGGLVLEPIAGYHDEPVCCLDFSSLYPSIGRAWNICYTTLVPPPIGAKMDPKDVYRSPMGHYFVRKHLKEGLLPRLWGRLLAARKVAKGDMKKCANEAKACAAAMDKLGEQAALFAQGVQDGRQLAIKLVANAMYGFTGVDVVKAGGMLTSYEVSESITAIGRQQLKRICAWVLEHYPGSAVVYGDTVSLRLLYFYFARLTITVGQYHGQARGRKRGADGPRGHGLDAQGGRGNQRRPLRRPCPDEAGARKGHVPV